METDVATRCSPALQPESVTVSLVAQSTVVYCAEVDVHLCISGVNQWLNLIISLIVSVFYHAAVLSLQLTLTDV